MQLIHVVPALSEEASGPSYSVLRLCESLVSLGHETTLAALDWAPLSRGPSFVKTFPLGFGPVRLGRSPAMYRWLREKSVNSKVDVVHNHGMWQMNAVYPAWATKQTDVQLVYSPRGAFSPWAMQHGSSAKRVFWPLLQLGALKQATCFHATAESEYCDIRRLGFRQPVAIIPNGVDLSALPDREPSPERTLLFLGRVHVVKGLDLLLPAWQSVQDNFSDWRLVIVGSDDGYHGPTGFLEKIKRQASQLGLKRIHFLGPLYGAQKRQAYRDADLFVLPSYSENFAVTVAEALSMETPAVVSKGAPWSGLSEQNAGWWIDIGLEPLVECLKHALACPPDELAAMGQRGRAWMERDFSWDGIGARTADTYRWLCDRSLPVPAWVRLD